MKFMLLNIIIANMLILFLQGLVLLVPSFIPKGSPQLFDVLLHFIFTTRENYIILLNFPVGIIIYYAYLNIKKKLTLRWALLSGVVNFFILYAAAWLQALAILAKDG